MFIPIYGSKPPKIAKESPETSILHIDFPYEVFTKCNFRSISSDTKFGFLQKISIWNLLTRWFWHFYKAEKTNKITWFFKKSSERLFQTYLCGFWRKEDIIIDSRGVFLPTESKSDVRWPQFKRSKTRVFKKFHMRNKCNKIAFSGSFLLFGMLVLRRLQSVLGPSNSGIPWAKYNVLEILPLNQL